MGNNFAIDMAHKAAEQLQGTCKSIPELGEEFEDLEDDSDFCATLDSLVFECERCNWWCEISEMSEKCADDGGWYCDECED